MIKPFIRPLRISTDLGVIAELLSVCFSDSMDEDGERYIAYLHDFAQSAFFTKLAERNPEKYSLPAEGFVYEENGKLIGNVTLSPMKYQGGTVYLISNVAVHPDYRGKGIATLLTKTSLQYLECKGIKQVWLQVKKENQAALALYDRFHFQSFMTRTTWIRKSSNIFLKKPANITLRRVRKEEFDSQKMLMERIYPAELTAAYGFEVASTQPLLKKWIKSIVQNRLRFHWTAEQEGQVGFASYDLFPEQSYVNLWVTAPAGWEESFYRAMIPAVQAKVGKEIRVNFPEKEFEDCFHEIGMQELNTLIWQKRQIT